MVIGAASGSVHLYAPEPLRQWSIANTEFNAGAAVTNLDITYDGHWVLATTDHYLVIAPTQFRVGSECLAAASLQSLRKSPFLYGFLMLQHLF